MKIRSITPVFVPLLAALGLSACAKDAPPAADASSETAPPVAAEPEAVETSPLAEPEENVDELYVEGVAGGVMTHTLSLEAEVVAVDQKKREAVLRGPDGNELAVRVGKDAVNFYQVAVGDRVKVAMMRELVVFVDDGSETEPDGSAVVAGSAEKGEQPAGAVVASTKVTSKISAMDKKARTATLSFENGDKQTFEVRADVDMDKYKVGQEVVFLLTEMLALEVEKL